MSVARWLPMEVGSFGVFARAGRASRWNAIGKQQHDEDYLLSLVRLFVGIDRFKPKRHLPVG